MVGQLHTIQQGQQAKLSPALDYDVLIIGAGQVCGYPNAGTGHLD
jgi:hypothetical protein